MARFCVGKSYSSYEQLKTEISLYEKENFVNVAKKHSRTIETAIKRGSSKTFSSELVFAEVYFVCKHSYAHRERPTKKMRTTRTEKGCPFIMKFRASTDGQSLILTHFEETHNLERTEEEFKMNPKQRRVDAESSSSEASTPPSLPSTPPSLPSPTSSVPSTTTSLPSVPTTSDACTALLGVEPQEEPNTSDFDTTTRQRHILSFFIEKDVNDVLQVSGMPLGQESVETIAENIPSASLDLMWTSTSSENTLMEMVGHA